MKVFVYLLVYIVTEYKWFNQTIYAQIVILSRIGTSHSAKLLSIFYVKKSFFFT